MLKLPLSLINNQMSGNTPHKQNTTTPDSSPAVRLLVDISDPEEDKMIGHPSSTELTELTDSPTIEKYIILRSDSKTDLTLATETF
jgi:hypothetical protein